MDSDLVAYFTTGAPRDMPWTQIWNIAAIRRARGRPMTLRQYHALRLVLAAEELGCVK